MLKLVLNEWGIDSAHVSLKLYGIFGLSERYF